MEKKTHVIIHIELKTSKNVIPGTFSNLIEDIRVFLLGKSAAVDSNIDGYLTQTTQINDKGIKSYEIYIEIIRCPIGNRLHQIFDMYDNTFSANSIPGSYKYKYEENLISESEGQNV